jgi:hypothetical protein
MPPRSQSPELSDTDSMRATAGGIVSQRSMSVLDLVSRGVDMRVWSDMDEASRRLI